jgi:hypothetical protein
LKPSSVQIIFVSPKIPFRLSVSPDRDYLIVARGRKPSTKPCQQSLLRAVTHPVCKEHLHNGVKGGADVVRADDPLVPCKYRIECAEDAVTRTTRRTVC